MLLPLILLACLAAGRAAGPENLARRATVTASSEYSGAYLGRLAVDGVIPAAGGCDDAGFAWCVDGARAGDKAELTLKWSAPVRIAEVVYWGRTGWFAEECWKECRVTAGGEAGPVARVTLQRGHGPQPIILDRPTTTDSLTLHFAGSYGGANPGASEIEVYGEVLPAGSLKRFLPLPNGTPDVPAEVVLPQSAEMQARVRAHRLGGNEIVVVQRHELNPSHVYTYHVEGFRPGGGLFVTSADGARVRKLVGAGAGEILDCDVSYDARRILFSWRKGPAEGYHVYCINADGTGLHALTRGDWHDYNACWLPDGGVAFLSTRVAHFAYCWVSPVGLLHRMEADGSRVVRLSANIVNDFTPSVMADGRILYSRWEYVDRPAIPIQSLWSIRPDGTQLQAVYGNRVLSPATFMDARQIPGTNRFLCTMTSHNGPARGAIGLIDPSRGVNAQSAITNLTPDVNVNPVGVGDGNSIKGPYEAPCPIDANTFLFSARGTIAVRDLGGRQATILQPKDGLGYYCPRPLAPRPRPTALTAMSRPAPAGEAVVMLQDVYAGLSPIVKRGEVARIAVVEEMAKEVRTDVNNRAFGFQFPVISCGATYAAKKVWGFAPVGPDGSASFRVPAGVPLTFIAIDRQGRGVQRMRTFTHFMPGERQSCTGCHDHGNRSSTRGRAPMPARPLERPSWGVEGFDYQRVVQPVLDRRCGSCHSGARPSGGVDLAGDRTDFFCVSYESLARGRDSGGMLNSPYVNWIPTYNGCEANILQIAPKQWGSPRSRLAEIVVGGHPDAQGRKRVVLTDDERQRVLLWIDLNVPYYGTSKTDRPNAEGCRRILPPGLETVMADVAARRCIGCHPRGVPRQVWTRLQRPELNSFLLAPLAAGMGGSGRCGKPVFASTADPDYRALLATFEPVTAELARLPRVDMPGGKPVFVSCDRR